MEVQRGQIRIPASFTQGDCAEIGGFLDWQSCMLFTFQGPYVPVCNRNDMHKNQSLSRDCAFYFQIIKFYFQWTANWNLNEQVNFNQILLI